MTRCSTNYFILNSNHKIFLNIFKRMEYHPTQLVEILIAKYSGHSVDYKIRHVFSHFSIMILSSLGDQMESCCTPSVDGR